jgi:hypothetical protein
MPTLMLVSCLLFTASLCAQNNLRNKCCSHARVGRPIIGNPANLLMAHSAVATGALFGASITAELSISPRPLAIHPRRDYENRYYG